MKYNLITILGPTAVGKTRLAALLANEFNGEIISADSRQVYKGMDIGTGKDLDDYNVDGKQVNHHLIDVIDPKDEYNLFTFQQNFFSAFNKINDAGKIPFLVGGTGMYLHSVLKGYELSKAAFDENRYNELLDLDIEELKEILKRNSPALHNTTDLLVKERVINAILVSEAKHELSITDKVQINSLVLGVMLERAEVKTRITARLKHRLQNGMVDEVKHLVAQGISFERLKLFGLEYKFVGMYIKGEINYNDMFQKLNSAIHGFAKRQMTWYRKMEREGIEINWLEGADFNAARQIITEKYLAGTI
jgi:tRNA dimethylallyltransferase